MPNDTPLSPLADTLAVGDTVPAASTDHYPSPELARGASIGRYLVLDRIGAGGMGVVYAAYDPKLDRRVALKALFEAGDRERDTAGRSRLVREAKAMARLSHPNVVTVYDVVVEGEQVLVAMELIEGHSLRTWLQAKKRDWSEIRDAFLQAGEGLAAAHAAGLVHRDFKLENVFVGNDGRVRVGDFGLARATPSVRPHGETPPAGGASGVEVAQAVPEDAGAGVSREGMLVGTPAYMAPDQLRGAAADERSDQFSFCAALYEALHGAPPFQGTTLISLMQSMDEERVRPVPPNSAVPRWLRGVVARGLRKRPGDRYPSMRALLTALDVDPTRRRRRIATVVLGVLAVVLLGATTVRDRRAQELECRAVGQRLDGVWDDARRGAVHRAFLASGRPYAEDTFARTTRVLDAYASDWSKEAVATCESRRDARASDDLPARRAACFDGRLSELRAFVGVLMRAEGETVDRAVRAARALPALDACAGKDPLRGASAPSDPTVRDEAHALEERMNVADALLAAGRTAESLAASAQNLTEAERLAFPPLTARALLALAQVESEAGDFDASERTFHRASLAAEAAGTWEVAARAWIGEAKRAFMRGDFTRADERLDHATVWVDRVGEDDALRGALLYQRGVRLSEEGKYDDARALHLKALALFERGNDDMIGEALNALGVDADLQGRYEEGKSYYGRALARYEQLLGPDNPAVARELNNMGLMAADQSKYADAIAALSRALRIEESANGRDHPSSVETAANLAIVYDGAGRYDEALAIAERAVPAAEKAFGPDSPGLAFALEALSNALIGVHRAAEAVPVAERDLAIRRKGGSAPVNLADAQCNLGLALAAAKQDLVRARALLVEARAGYVAVGRTVRLPDIDEAMAAIGPGRK